MPSFHSPVEVDDLRKSLGGRHVLRGLSFRVNPGELYVIVGPDGAGKTTLIRILAGVISKTEGKVNILGHRIPEEISEVKGRMEYMPQRFSLYGDLTVEENLEFFRSLYRIPDREWNEKKEKLLSITALTDFKKRRASKLSGGMQKKLALASALIPNPEVLLLDEPTTGVDPISRRELWELFQDLLLQGVSILLTTPYMDEAHKAHRVGFLFEGRMLLEGPPYDLVTREYRTLDELFFHLVLKAYATGRS